MSSKILLSFLALNTSASKQTLLPKQGTEHRLANKLKSQRWVLMGTLAGQTVSALLQQRIRKINSYCYVGPNCCLRDHQKIRKGGNL